MGIDRSLVCYEIARRTNGIIAAVDWLSIVLILRTQMFSFQKGVDRMNDAFCAKEDRSTNASQRFASCYGNLQSLRGCPECGASWGSPTKPYENENAECCWDCGIRYDKHWHMRTSFEEEFAALNGF